MPGTGILDFEAHAKAIAKAGIYDFGIHHDQILVPVVLRHWGIEALEGLDAEAEQARAALVKRIGRIGKAGRRFAARRDEAQQSELAAGLRPLAPAASARRSRRVDGRARRSPRTTWSASGVRRSRARVERAVEVVDGGDVGVRRPG